MTSTFLNIDPFYGDLLDSWNLLRATIKTNIFGEIVAYNPKITIGNDIIRSRRLFNDSVTLSELLKYDDLKAQTARYQFN